MTSMAEEQSQYPCDYFDEDIVYRINKQGQIEVGVVIKSCENASSSEDDSDNESEESKKKLSSHVKRLNRLKPGTAKISWYPKGNYETLPEKKVKLYDRSLLPGDVVRYTDPSKNGLIGYCKSSEIKFNLKILGTNKIIENVDSEYFETLDSTQTDVVCIYKSWVGYIDDTCYNVTLLCKDGSIVVLQDEDLNDFEDILDEKSRSYQFSSEHHYIGQRLIGPRKVLKKGNWINQSQEMASALASKKLRKRRIQVTVINVELVSITCRWMCCINRSNELGNANGINVSFKQTGPSVEESADDSDSSLKENQWCVELTNHGQKVTLQECNDLCSLTEGPCEIICGDEVKQVKTLNYFKRCTLQVGDLGYYTLKETDKMINSTIFVKKLTNKILRERFDVQTLNQKPNKNQETENQADPISSVVSSNSESEKNLSRNHDHNCNNNVNSFQQNINGTILSEDEYEEISDSENDSILGYLTRCVMNELNISKDKVSRKKKYPSVSVKRVKEKRLKPSRQHERSEIPLDLSRDRRFAVQIVSTETKVDVIWQNNEETADIPSYLLYPVHHLDGHEFFPGDYVIENRDGASLLDYGVVQKADRSARTVLVKWYKTQTTDPKPIFLSEENVSAYDIKDHPDHHFRSGCCVVRVDTMGNDTYPDNPDSKIGQVLECGTDGLLLCAWADGTKSKVYPHELFIIAENDGDDIWSSEIFHPEEKSKEEEKPVNFNCSKMVISKGEFTMMESVPDSHSFKASILYPNEHFYRKIKKEIALLRGSLPLDIYVKSFEERIDLFTVMIKGPSDTPYEDGLFLFDIQLPAEYPFVPPLVHYKSYCSDRLNPNLYECGKVCISLLGTWSGKGTEVWDSKSSTLLQLLLSIQGLILVDEPYYNEAGYMKQKGTNIGHENSRLYNEMVIVKLIQSMTKLISLPNEVFKDEILEHFFTRMKFFVARIENWLKVSHHWNEKHSASPSNKMLALLKSDGFDSLPGFPLLPGSQGFCLSAQKALNILKDRLKSLDIPFC